MTGIALHDRHAERAVLAACMASSVARQEARKHLTGGDFWEPAHEHIWDRMSMLDRHKRPIDAVTLLAVAETAAEKELVTELVTTVGIPDHVATHAEIVRAWSIKRRLHDLATSVSQHCLNPSSNAVGYAANIATQFAQIRDFGLPDSTNVETLDELLDGPDEPPEWIVPGLLERRDRLILTGEEGLGKSYLLRQIAVLAAAGLHPFETTKIPPLKATIIDCENSRAQVRRKVRPLYEFAKRYGKDPGNRVLIECSRRIDITIDKDLAAIHQILDAQQPDLVVIGPLYRLVPRALQSDDEAAPLLAALDTLRERGPALLVEAHAGHTLGRHGQRDLRPRGSSALLGWPEFGYGMRGIDDDNDHDIKCNLVPWRGDRDERDYPKTLRQSADGYRWVPCDVYPGIRS